MTWLGAVRVVPVVALPTVAAAAPLASALAEGGLPLIEVTLRTPAALEGIARIRAELPDVLVGAGTLLSPSDVQAAVDAGAQFLVSPGCTDRLLDAMLATGLPCLPGAATPSEVLRLLERGVTMAKFFPAESAGGAAALAALAGPLPQVTWCATGGISPSTAASYLAVPTVAAVGGGWMAPASAVADGNWAAVTRLAKDAAAL